MKNASEVSLFFCFVRISRRSSFTYIFIRSEKRNPFLAQINKCIPLVSGLPHVNVPPPTKIRPLAVYKNPIREDLKIFLPETENFFIFHPLSSSKGVAAPSWIKRQSRLLLRERIKTVEFALNFIWGETNYRELAVFKLRSGSIGLRGGGWFSPRWKDLFTDYMEWQFSRYWFLRCGIDEKLFEESFSTRIMTIFVDPKIVNLHTTFQCQIIIPQIQ